MLKSLDIKHLIIGGVFTDCCVLATVLDADCPFLSLHKINYRKLIVHKIIRLKMTSNLVVVRRNKKIKIILHFLESISFIVMYNWETQLRFFQDSVD
ncbi:hypothetical protein CN689_05475 [Peribacillus butanolivorans]|uniref:Isochorismatase-like domain-containing protein n=2 Tax=Peribacillus butanolivorans TaxID=421767 RepID=A0AAX0S5A4_9BACI|nr:hypothetical protein CN689_05475 [Peribacillus butanolivorans]